MCCAVGTRLGTGDRDGTAHPPEADKHHAPPSDTAERRGLSPALPRSGPHPTRASSMILRLEGSRPDSRPRSGFRRSRSREQAKAIGHTFGVHQRRWFWTGLEGIVVESDGLGDGAGKLPLVRVMGPNRRGQSPSWPLPRHAAARAACHSRGCSPESVGLLAVETILPMSWSRPAMKYSSKHLGSHSCGWRSAWQ